MIIMGIVIIVIIYGVLLTVWVNSLYNRDKYSDITMENVFWTLYSVQVRGRVKLAISSSSPFYVPYQSCTIKYDIIPSFLLFKAPFNHSEPSPSTASFNFVNVPSAFSPSFCSPSLSVFHILSAPLCCSSQNSSMEPWSLIHLGLLYWFCYYSATPPWENQLIMYTASKKTNNLIQRSIARSGCAITRVRRRWMTFVICPPPPSVQV